MLTRQRSALLLPLTGFLLVFFVAPLVWLLSLAVREAEVPRALPRTLSVLQTWQPGQALPPSLFPVLEGPDLTHNGATDIFVAKVNVAGTALNYAGYLGGNGGDPGRGIAVDNDGNAFVTGTAASSGGSFPVVVGPDLSFNGYIDAFVSRVTEPSDTVFRDGFE